MSVKPSSIINLLQTIKLIHSFIYYAEHLKNRKQKSKKHTSINNTTNCTYTVYK